MSEQSMAREMTPQERAEYAAANIYDVVKRFAYPYASIEKIVLRAVTETRRAALLEASKVAMTYGEQARDEDLSGSYTSELIVQALDRLAQEG